MLGPTTPFEEARRPLTGWNMCPFTSIRMCHVSLLNRLLRGAIFIAVIKATSGVILSSLVLGCWRTRSGTSHPASGIVVVLGIVLIFGKLIARLVLVGHLSPALVGRLTVSGSRRIAAPTCGRFVFSHWTIPLLLASV